MAFVDEQTVNTEFFKGYYVVLKVSAEPGSLDEFNRLAKLDSNVIRFLITVDHQ
jgi:ribosomal protein S6